MAAFSKEHVYNQMKSKGLCCYEVLDDDKKTLLDDGEASTGEKAAEQLAEFLEDVKGRHVYIKCFSEKHEGRGGSISKRYTYKVDLTGNATENTTTGKEALSIGSLEKIYNEKAELLARIKELEHKNELEKMRNEFDKKIEDSQDKTAQILQSFAPMISGLFTPKTPPIQGTVINGTEQDLKAKLQAAIVKLKKVDPDYIETLTQLANFAEAKPEQYHSFKPMLKTL